MSSIPLSKKPVWDRFWPKVAKAGPDECWNWQASVDTRGYGHLGVDRKPVRAHRVAWTLEKGNIPSGFMVLHKCDNKRCCNPSHLFLGTHADNMADMRAKQRRKGIGKHEANGRAKLTLRQVAEIRAHPFGKIRLSRLYGVSSAQIQRIRAGKQWLPDSSHDNRA